MSESVIDATIITLKNEEPGMDCEVDVDKENIQNQTIENETVASKVCTSEAPLKCEGTLIAGAIVTAEVVATELESVEEQVEDEDETMEVVSAASMESFEEVEAEPKDIEDILDEIEEESFESNEDTLLQDADGVIAFKMSLQKRLNELHDAFENFGQGGLSLSNFWTLYFETYVEPMGWKALWKQRDESYNDGSVTLFKAIETVEVTQVNCANLSARAQRGDGSGLSIPLNELYPLAHQENSFLAMKVTAKCIDNYRFFLNHLVFPWDSENADRWCELHLESRIQFYYDIQSGVISETVSNEIRELIREAKSNKARIESLEDKLGFADSEEDIIDEDLVSEMLPLHMRQEEIKARLQMLENPLWRNMLNKHKLIKNRSTSRIEESNILVVEKFSVDELKSDLDFLGERVDRKESIKIVPNLQEALERCKMDAKIFVKPGVHKISGLGNLEEGGSIIGINNSNETPVVIEPKDAGDVWLVANTEKSVSLENIRIRVIPKWTPPTSSEEEESISVQEAASPIVLLVLRGKLNLETVVVEGFSGDSGISYDEQETVGIKALEQGIVTAKNCLVKNFVCGMVIREQAKLHLDASTLSNCVVGIETNPGGFFKLNSVCIEKCQRFGIIVYATSEVTPSIGGIELLQSDESVQNGFTLTEVTLLECQAGQICICNEAAAIDSLNLQKKDE